MSPCKTLMGYVHGRYVEREPTMRMRSVRCCRWCGADMPRNARNSGCSPECSKAIVLAKAGRPA